jgi:hypothetical protein
MPAKRRKRPRESRGGTATPAKRTPTPKGKPKPKKLPKRPPKKSPKPPPKRSKPAPRKPAKAPKRPKPKPAKAPKRKAPKGKGKPAKAPKRKPAKAPKRPSSARSDAAHKGWIKRRKRQRLLDAMADLEMKKADEDVADNAQPIGWTVRRETVREIDGQRWHRIAVEFSETEFQARRLAILEELQIDLLTKGELYDYLSWAGDHYDIEISDMYRMYLGYSVGEAQAEPD